MKIPASEIIKLFDKDYKIENDFEVSSVYGCGGDHFHISNAVIIKDWSKDPDPKVSSCTDCLVLTHSTNNGIVSNKDGNNIIQIYSNKCYELYNKIVNELLLNEPTTLDEMKMIYREDGRKDLLIQRCIMSDRNISIGLNTKIGITGDRLFTNSKGETTEIAQVGGVIIGKNVRIGNNVIIYRGLTEATVIEDNTIIDDFVVIHSDAVVSGYIKSFKEIY